MPTLARILELNIFRTQEFVNLTSFIFSTSKASKDNVMLAYHGAIANVVDQTFPVPKTAEADGTVSVHVNISAPNISNPIHIYIYPPPCLQPPRACLIPCQILQAFEEGGRRSSSLGASTPHLKLPGFARVPFFLPSACTIMFDRSF